MGDLEDSLREIVSNNFDSPLQCFDQISSGASHYTYSFKLENEREYVFKASDYDWSGLPEHENGFSIDGPILDYLEQNTIPTPELVGFDNSENKYGFKYLITTKLPGHNMFEAWEEINLSTVRDSGRILAELHNSTSFSNHGKLGYEKSGKDLHLAEKIEWNQMVEDMIYTFSENLKETKFSEYVKEIRELFEKNRKFLRDNSDPVLVHQEFSPRNMMTKDEKITGVIDWERAISGDPEYDLFIAEKQFTTKTKLFEGTSQTPEEIKQALRSEYTKFRNLEDGWRERRKIYQLIYITQIMWVLDDIVDSQKLTREYNEIKEKL